MKKLFAVALGLMLVAAFAGTLYFLYKKAAKPPVAFETKPPAQGSVVKKTVATGSVVPRKEVEIKPQVSGIVDELLVEPGKKVASGDVVARIRIVPDMVSLNNAETRLNLARINRDNAERELRRGQELARQGTIATAELDARKVAHESALEELAAAESNLDLIKKGSTARTGTATNTLVRATIGGTVLEVPLEAGASVIESNTFNAGTTIATIADMSDMIFLGKVDESEVGKLRPGMELELTVGAIEGKKLSAKLEHIAPKGVKEEGAIQFEIRAALAVDESLSVRANYSANADIVLDRRDDVLTLDEALLQFDDGKPFVEVEVGTQKFEKRTVEVGLSDGIVVEVKSGLDLKDRVKDPREKGAKAIAP
ncbi:MAG: efflux RND transporter periplasmic adaptor subunit [Acidobacteriota bacterium]